MSEIELKLADLAEAKKSINCLVFAIDDASVLADVKRIMQGLVDEIDSRRARPDAAAIRREALEEAAKVCTEPSDAQVEAVAISLHRHAAPKWQVTWEKQLPEYREHMRGRARAAIRALQEPGKP